MAVLGQGLPLDFKACALHCNPLIAEASLAILQELAYMLHWDKHFLNLGTHFLFNIKNYIFPYWSEEGSPGGSDSSLPGMWETQVRALGWEDPLEKGTVKRLQ